MTQSFKPKPRPSDFDGFPFEQSFDGFDENMKKVKRNSLTHRNSQGNQSRASTSSFVSATDTELKHPDQLAQLEEKLRQKNQKKGKEKFKKLTKMTDMQAQSKEFGDLVDIRASDPIRIRRHSFNTQSKAKRSPEQEKKSKNSM